MSPVPRASGVVWALAALLLAAGVSAALLADTLALRYERDVSRMVFNDNLQLLDRIRRQTGAVSDSLEIVLASATVPAPNRRW